MSLFNVFKIASSGMGAQSARLNAISSNLANAESSAVGSNGEIYRAKQVELVPDNLSDTDANAVGVKVKSVVADLSPYKILFNPDHPDADAAGYVKMPNVDVVEEMVNMMSASRSYQNNVDTFNMAKSLVIKTLSLGQ